MAAVIQNPLNTVREKCDSLSQLFNGHKAHGNTLDVVPVRHRDLQDNSVSPLSLVACLWTVLGDQFYREAIEHCRSYNARLCAERSVRLPFLDSQTGVAQNNCYIWMERHHRGPGLAAGQMYSYPARCWRKKRRLHTSMDSTLHLYGLNIDGSLAAKDSLPPPSTALEALLRGDALDKRNSSRDEDSLLEIQRVLEADALEDGYHDADDFDIDIPKRKHRGKGRGRGAGRRRADLHEDKPYVYENRYKQKQNSKASTPVCGKRYRNRTGLSYHYDHSHIADKEEPQSKETARAHDGSINHRPQFHKQGKSSDAGHVQNHYCEVCQLNSGSNLKDGKCSKCGRSDVREEIKEVNPVPGAEELFGASSESETSTFHGFEEDELEEDASPKCR